MASLTTPVTLLSSVVATGASKAVQADAGQPAFLQVTGITTSPMMPNNFSEIIRVSPGQKIAVIKDATVTSSTFSVTELI